MNNELSSLFEGMTPSDIDANLAALETQKGRDILEGINESLDNKSINPLSGEKISTQGRQIAEAVFQDLLEKYHGNYNVILDYLWTAQQLLIENEDITSVRKMGVLRTLQSVRGKTVYNAHVNFVIESKQLLDPAHLLEFDKDNLDGSLGSLGAAKVARLMQVCKAKSNREITAREIYNIAQQRHLEAEAQKLKEQLIREAERLNRGTERIVETDLAGEREPNLPADSRVKKLLGKLSAFVKVHVTKQRVYRVCTFAVTAGTVISAIGLGIQPAHNNIDGTHAFARESGFNKNPILTNPPSHTYSMPPEAHHPLLAPEPRNPPSIYQNDQEYPDTIVISKTNITKSAGEQATDNKEGPYISQEFPGQCGAAVLGMIEAQFLNENAYQVMKDVTLKYNLQPKQTLRAQVLIQELRDRGLNPKFAQNLNSPEYLEKHFETQNTPIILLVNAYYSTYYINHWIIIDDYKDGRVIVRDPYESFINKYSSDEIIRLGNGRLSIPIEVFKKASHGTTEGQGIILNDIALQTN